MSEYNIIQAMIERVALALGDDLLREMVFVGGCTTGLLLTDEISKDSVRATDDVDLIVSILTKSDWDLLEKQLCDRGFTHSLIEDDPICALRLDELRVDFMPTGDVLGFSNQWYQGALESATDYPLTDLITIKLITPPYFMATKFEAYSGRGNSDVMLSRDIEDILTIVDGREELLDEISNSSSELRIYIKDQVKHLLADNYIEYTVDGTILGGEARKELVYERLEALCNMDA